MVGMTGQLTTGLPAGLEREKVPHAGRRRTDGTGERRNSRWLPDCPTAGLPWPQRTVKWPAAGTYAGSRGSSKNNGN